jgi:IclR family pca regulon transcriptional regulator
VTARRDSRQAPLADERLQAPAGDPDFMLSLARGLATIRAFGQGASSLSVGDVARVAGLSRASARRCLHTLARLGYATASGGRYELTPAILTLSHAYLSSTSVARIAQPVLERVSDELHESSSVAVLDGDEIVYVARAAARRILAISLEVGSRLPAACTSMGRVLLAAADPDDRARFLARVELRRHTARTTTDRAALAAELETVRAQGYAIVDQELELGLRSCAVPIARGDGTVVAAINVGAHAARLDAEALRNTVVPLLHRAADEIGAALGAARDASEPAARVV